VTNDQILIDVARQRIFDLIAEDIKKGDSPFVEHNRGPRSTEIMFTVKLQGMIGDGVLAMNVRERK